MFASHEIGWWLSLIRLSAKFTKRRKGQRSNYADINEIKSMKPLAIKRRQ